MHSFLFSLLRIKKSVAIVVIFAFFSVTLTTAAPFQNNSILNSSWDFSSSSTTFQYVYASTTEGGGGGDEEGGGGGGGDEEGGGGGGDEEGGGGGDEEGGGGGGDEEGGGGGGDEEGGGGGGDEEGRSTPAKHFDSNENNNAGLENQNTNEDTTQSESETEGNVQSFLPEILKQLEEIPPAPPLDPRFKPYDPSEAKISIPIDKLSTPSGSSGDATIPGGGGGAASEPAPPASGATTEEQTTEDDDNLAEEQTTEDDDNLAEEQSSNLAPQGLTGIKISGAIDALNKAAEEALKQTGTGLEQTGGAASESAPPASKTDPAGGGSGTGTTPTGGSGGGGTSGNANLPPPPGGSQQPKNDSNENGDDRVKVVERNKVVYRDNNDNTDKELIVIGDTNTCPTQTETVSLNGKIDPKGIRLLADFDPCLISDGSVTLNMPNSDNIKLALLFIDKAGNNDVGTTVEPIKIQDISTNQALFTIELDGNMNGIQPMTGQSNTITRINGLALYNDGNEPIQFNSGNMAALTATFTK